uniref:hypothetical protein n=1 Tax=Amanita sinensis TaxID=67728 RepID=UPI001D12E463|nr:hypothetical protein LK379_mgp34 [Amanita sinensis]QZN08155.1 hypothetical protein [Amanita sinensis]
MKKFFIDFIYEFSHPITLKTAATIYLSKAVRSLFLNRNFYKLNSKQLIGLILKVRFTDDSVKSLSHMYRADKTSITKIIEIFKQDINLRIEDYEKMQIVQLIISYHIFSEDYMDSKLSNEQKKEIISKNIIKKEVINNIPYSTFDTIFKIPLNFIGHPYFLINIFELNDNLSVNNNNSMYKLILNEINKGEYEIKILGQNNILKYRFVDKIINFKMIERSFANTTYSINLETNEILLINHLDINKHKGFIKTIKLDNSLSIENLRKFITLDF